MKDVPIVEAPDWLCEWVASKGTKEKSKSTAGKHDLKTSPEFEFVDFVEHFDIEVEDDYGSNWYVTPVCPYSGTSHEHSLRTAFYWDGIHLGFHCFAGGCGSPTIGDLIRKLNEAHEPFPGEIWPGYAQPDLNDPRWNIDMDEVTIEEVSVSPGSAATIPPIGMTAPSTILSVDASMAILGAELIPEDQVAAVSAANKAKVIPISAPAALVAPVEVEDYDFTFDMEDDRSSRIVIDFPRVEPPNDEFLPFPMDAMYGKLGEMASNLNAPYGFVYPSLLTIACGLDIEDRGGNVRGTLYTALLGGVNFGKSIVTQRAKKSIYTGEGTIEEGTPGSDRGLINDIGEDGLRKVFLQDELRNLLSKCAIQGSSLTPVLCKLWSSNIGAASDKRSKDICNGVVSILGNLAVEDCGDFAKIMGSETTRGLYDRMLFGIGPMVDFYPCDIKMHHVDVKPCLVPSWCYTKMHEWIAEDRFKRRVGEIALRVALIQSAVNGDKEVTQASFDCAFRLADWQYAIRMVYRAGKAESKEAEAFEAVAGALQQQLDKQLKTGKAPGGAVVDSDMGEDYTLKQLHWSAIMNNKSLYRKHGSPLLNRIKQSMINERILVTVYEVEEDGELSREPSPFVILRGRIK